MAKTFNPNRVGGGGVSIVRAADGTYSLKETGFDQISSLNMIDLGTVAKVTPPKVIGPVTSDPKDELKNQTKAAFLLPKQDRGDDPFTTEKMLRSATDVSKDLQTTFDKPNMREVAGNRVSTFNATTFDDAVGTRIKDPTESVFGRSMPSEEQFERQDVLPSTSVETPQEKLAVTSANVQKGLVDPPGFTNPFKGFLGSKFQTEKGTSVNVDKGRGSPTDEKYRSEVAQGGMPTDVERRQQRQLGMTDEERRQQFQLGSLGISADPSKTTFGTAVDQEQGFTDIDRFKGVSTMGALAGEGEKDNFVSIPAKTTFRESVNTALKGVGEAVKFMSPVMGVVKALGTPRNESASTTAFNKGKFNIVTSSGSMQGRIVGDDGTYDPGNNLFHGMNRSSAFGNLEKAGQKRIDNINKTLARQAKSGKQSQTLIDRRDKFERELNDYRSDKNDHNIRSAKKKGIDTSKLNPNEMRNVAETGNESGNTSGKSIVCTAMYQTTGLQDWSKAMKIWYIYQKKYLTIQHQEGYHKLFKPFVKGMHKSNIIKAVGAHFAKHRTQHLKHIMFNSKPSLLGKIYNKILEPICYWAGKK